MNSPLTIIAVALAKQVVRLTALAQLNVPTNFVPRCFTGLCIPTAMNGSNITSDEGSTDIVPKSLLFRPQVRSSTYSMRLEPTPAASEFGLFPAGGEVPRIQSGQGHGYRQ